MLRRSSIGVALILISACGGSSSPTSPSTPAGSTEIRTLVLGQTVDAITGAAAANITVLASGGTATTSDAQGWFQLDAASGSIRARMQSSGTIEREAIIRPQDGERARLSLIPTTFDLSAFDEMFRSSNARLQRWAARPSLVIVAAAMDYQGEADAYTATSDRLFEEEVAQMTADLSEGLSLLTGGTYSSFASVEIERPAAGARVQVLRQGKIVVGRYNGIAADGGRVGYGRWFSMSDGSIAGGAIFLDPKFDRNDSRRRLLRIHELGHALGYNHVTKRSSIMNPIIGTEPTDFDRAAASIAFQRPIGNQSPDADPDGTRAMSIGGAVGWSEPIDCSRVR